MFDTPALPPDHPLAPFALAMLAGLRLLFAIMALFFVAKAVLFGWLVWDRRQQRKRDGEFYHTIRDVLAPVVARLVLLEALTKTATAEIKSDVKKNPDETATKVVDAISHAHDSGTFKNPPPTGGS